MSAEAKVVPAGVRDVVGDARALADAIARAGGEGCSVAVVSGSGLGAIGGSLENAREISFLELPEMPGSKVPGHAGRFLVGDWGGRRVIVQEGRVHLYEGWSVHEVTRAVRAFAALGVETLFLTNAAGGLRTEWSPGTLMRLTDHVNLQGVALLLPEERGPARIYDERLGALLDAGAQRVGATLQRGVYVGLLGPTYETPSEVRALARFGLDAVGMSTVAEASAAAACGLRVAAVSCVTNPAAGLSPEPLLHEDVVVAANAAAGDLARIFDAAISSSEL